MTAQALIAMDDINRRAWRDPRSVALFESLRGWTDPGERAALGFVAATAKDEPILDIGVGAGRTVPLLRAISRDYVAIDYTPELVEACRKRYPSVPIFHGDARDLSRFSTGTFQLVVFSFNGVDAVSPRDREQILREVRRVLRRGGQFLFSAHNRSGPGYGEKLTLGVYPTRNPFKLAARLGVALAHAGTTVQNYVRYGRLKDESDDYSVRNASAHNHGILVHYITLRAQLAQLTSAGFSRVSAVFGNLDTHALSLDEDTSAMWWFHFVAEA
jgi:SAM-dependent methyltransferase